MIRQARTRFIILTGIALIAAALLASVHAQNPATQAELLLGRALNLEENEGRLREAIATYQQVLSAADATRPQKARAQFRIAACYERLGVAEAQSAYETVVREYGDQEELAGQAKAKLTSLGGASTAAARPREPVVRLLWSKPGWFSAALSPDGRSVAFIDLATANLWVRDIATGVDRKLTTIPEDKTWSDFPLDAAWSRDGTRIAYSWFSDGGRTAEIRTIDLETGAVSTFDSTRTLIAKEPLDWSPDGKRILMRLHGDVLAWLSLADGVVTPLTGVPSRYPGRARVSPDGAHFVFGAQPLDDRLDRDLFIASADGTSTDLLLGGPGDDGPVAWTPDGRGLLFHGRRSGTDGLWLLRVSGGRADGPPELVRDDLSNVSFWGLARTGALLYRSGAAQSDLYIAAVDLSQARVGPTQIIAVPDGVVPSSMVSWSADRAHLVYLARQGQRWVLVTAAADGSNPRIVLPPFRPSAWAPPTWASDGTAFFVSGRSPLGPSAREETKGTIYRVEVKTGEATPLVESFQLRRPGEDSSILVAASPDGRVIYKQKNHEGTRLVSLWSIDVETGTEKELFRSQQPAGIFPGPISPDGRRLPFMLNRFDGGKEVMVLRLSDGEATRLCAYRGGALNSFAWAPDGRSVVFTQADESAAGSVTELWEVSTAGGEPFRLGISLPILRGVAIHPDGKRLAYIGGTRPNEEVWLMENFLAKVIPHALK